MVRLAVENGLSAADAIKLATLNVARCHGLEGLGAIAPGYAADICVLPDLASFVPEMVLRGGRVVVSEGKVLPFEASEESPRFVRDTVHISTFTARDFKMPVHVPAPTIRVIELYPIKS